MIDLKTFIFAGSACFTLTDLSESDRHYTYRINKKEPDPAAVQQYKTHGGKFKPETVWFVGLGISYDSSVYAGLMKHSGAREIMYTKASRLTPNAPSMKLLARFLGLVQDGKFKDCTEFEGIRFQHEGRCCVCSRPLTNPTSIDMGIGPECAGNMGM